jgi:desulfoferrodoxin (superoxide reductase-like protein)
MRKLKKGFVFFFVVLMIMGFSQNGFANKSAVTIEAPESAEKGSEINIKINISHKGNNFIHHTNWVYVKINGEEIARWEFSGSKKPEAENFTREVKYTIQETIEIEAAASCNLHGSAGPVQKTVTVQ